MDVQVKPHLRHKCGYWWCGSVPGDLYFAYAGVGPTLFDAFRDWSNRRINLPI